MAYEILTVDDLQKLAATLPDNYKGSNPDRINFVTLINKLTAQKELINSEHAAKILMGAYVFEMEHIENAYHLRSPNNSRLYDLLEDGLKINKENSLTNERKLIYLSAFYKYIQSEAPKDIVADTTWMAKEALLRPVLIAVINLLSKQQPQIKCLLTSQPTIGQLHKNMNGLEERYNKMCKPGWILSGNAHAPLAKFIDLIHEYCDKYYPIPDINSIDPAVQFEKYYMLRMAAMVYAMKMIEDEYVVRSGSNSNLHVMCGKTINIKRTADLDIDDKVTWLSILSSEIKNMLENHKKTFLDPHEKAGYKNIQVELGRIQANIWQNLAIYQNEKFAPSHVQQNMTLATSGVAQYGINAVIRNVAGEVIPSPAGMFLDSAAGVTGFAILGPGGAVLASTLSRLVRTHIIPLAIAGIFAGALDRIGTRIGEITTGVVILPFSLSAKGLKSMMDWYSHVEFDKNELRKNEEWIEALISLPDDVFAPDKKAVIETTYGFTSAKMN